MKKTILGLLASIGTAACLHAQIPTIDVSSLQQLYAQYQTMQQELSTAKGILNQTTQIYNQDVSIYQNALGNINLVRNRIQGWMGSFQQLSSTDFFGGRAAPIQNFDNSVNYWANQLASGSRDLASLEKNWETSLERVSAGTATDWEQHQAMAGYNSRLIDNARASRNYGSNVVAQSASVVTNAQDGTLIEQAGAQNALLYQQTALLNKMGNDINDATVAEAAQRNQQLREQQNEAVINRAIANIPIE